VSVCSCYPLNGSYLTRIFSFQGIFLKINMRNQFITFPLIHKTTKYFVIFIKGFCTLCCVILLCIVIFIHHHFNLIISRGANIKPALYNWLLFMLKIKMCITHASLVIFLNSNYFFISIKCNYFLITVSTT